MKPHRGAVILVLGILGLIICAPLSSGWFSKELHEEGKITRESAERFGWFGLEKMRLELAARARVHAD